MLIDVILNGLDVAVGISALSANLKYAALHDDDVPVVVFDTVLHGHTLFNCRRCIRRFRTAYIQTVNRGIIGQEIYMLVQGTAGIVQRTDYKLTVVVAVAFSSSNQIQHVIGVYRQGVSQGQNLQGANSYRSRHSRRWNCQSRKAC